MFAGNLIPRNCTLINDGAGFKMVNSNQDFIKHSFLCGVRGFHVYNEICKPIVGELLRCSHERNDIVTQSELINGSVVAWPIRL